MPLSRLSLTDFRNHADEALIVADGFVLLSGPNGAGKTNILEAVSLLTPGRGLRRAPLSDMARKDGEGGWAVAARILPSPSGEGIEGWGRADTVAPPRPSSLSRPSPEAEGIDIGTGTLSTAPERRQVRINGAPASVNALSERLSVLWLTPAMDRLFTDSASGRRRFLDRLVLALEPAHAHHSARYEAAMRARNKLLAEAAQDPEGGADPAWLLALEAGMAEHGEPLAAARARTVDALADAIAASPDGDFPRAGLSLEGWDTNDLAAILKANRGRDAAAGRATAGPHRQDLIVTYEAKAQPAALGSTGEQKALLIGMILAHAALVTKWRGAPPVLLLDEVAAHLDPDRRAALFERLGGCGQVWMTGTEESLFDGIGEASRFHVEIGIHAA